MNELMPIIRRVRRPLILEDTRPSGGVADAVVTASAGAQTEAAVEAAPGMVVPREEQPTPRGSKAGGKRPKGGTVAD